jgi:deoxyhypusine synthase
MAASHSHAAADQRTDPQQMAAVRAFLDQHFQHFNSREVVDATRAFEAHIQAGGKMLVTLAGAMSTAKIGQTLAPLIRAGYVHAICCTGANLEEDVFNLLAAEEYERCSDWRSLSAEDEQALLQRGMNRVTDTCIPETVMRHLEQRLIRHWQHATQAGERLMPGDVLGRILDEPDLAEHFQWPADASWLMAAKAAGIPVYTPGWEDSTTGNFFAAAVMRGDLPHHQCIQTGTEQMQHLAHWYVDNCHVGQTAPSVGFFQIGGGIAGDFAICSVPMLMQDLQRDDLPTWGYFCQISDAQPSYGGYSGAVPNEKITWGKLAPETPRYMIQSDATIVAPLMFGYLLAGTSD